MNKILLIPGSFNPITNAHVDMALAAKKAVNADSIYFIPAHDTYVAKKKTLIPGYCRVELINSMDNCAENNIHALDIETTSFFPQRTYNTISQLREEAEKNYEFNEYYICLGMDNIKTLTSWYNWEPFVNEYNFVACVREGQNLDEALKDANLTDYRDHFTEIKIPENHTSSSLVRDLCEKGEFNRVKELVPENVYEYLVRFYDVMNRM